MADSTKYVKLKRSETCGFGFSILGGADSELPPIIYDIIEGSPAANCCQLFPGDVIWEVNGTEVVKFTTKEVLNCLRLSANEVTLKLKSDEGIQKRVQHFLATPDDPEILRAAITKDDLHGVCRIKAKQAISSQIDSIPSLISPIHSNGSDKILSKVPAPTLGSNRTASVNGLPIKDRTTAENERNILKKPKSEAYLMTEEDGYGKNSLRTSSTTSPPLSEDESDIESLHSFHYSPKAVDVPSAVRLAKRLFGLEGFKKSDVSRHLSKNNEFSRAVAEEFLNYFDFHGDTLDVALRKFLNQFCLTGETQERERVLVHFSRRYLNCNPGSFNSQDAVHTLTCAIMLLNTDLHGTSIGRKMTVTEFIDNLADLNDGEHFPRDVLKALYQSIHNQPLKWATDDDVDSDTTGKGDMTSDSNIVIGSNPFLSPQTGSGIQYKKGYIMRKCVTDPNGKRTAFGKRSWKMWFCVVQDLVMYLHKDEQGARRGPQHAQLGQNAIRLHHGLATRAHDYAKKEHVFRLQTADQAEYLLQTSDSKELQAWIDTINFVAASLSAAPLPGAVGSQRKFQRPLLPCSITKLNLGEQLEDHLKRLTMLEQELDEHNKQPPDKAARSTIHSSYREKEAYLTFEVNRYRTYVYLLRSKVSTQPGVPQPIQQHQGNLEVGDLPVFEAHPSVEGVETGDPGGRVVPPPIPERARPGDSTENLDETLPTILRDEEMNIIKKNDGVYNTNNKIETLDNKKNIALGDQKENMKNKILFKIPVLKSKELKIEKENNNFIKELEKKEKDMLLRQQEMEKKEIAKLKKEQDKDKKEQIKLNKKENQLLSQEVKKQEFKEKINEIDVKKSVASKSNVPIIEKELEEDPRVGTLNRLSALFKFSKLNNNRGPTERDDIETAKEIDAKPDIPPPLPPKPPPNSPIMKNIGTRMDI